MGSEWRLVGLNDLGEVARGRSRHRPRYAEHLYGGQYPFIQTGDIKASGGLITSHLQTYSEEGLAQSRLWPSGTLCITIAANIAETGILTYPACFPDSVIGFIADPAKCDVRFIEYSFRLLKEKLQKEAIGSVQDNINLATFERLRFAIPDIAEQRRIAQILGSLDDKIELNRQMNTTLEAMAQALFKSWFVDFDPVIDNALAAGNEIPAELAARAERRAQAVHPTSSEQTHTLPAAIRQQFPDRFVFTDTMDWVPEGWEVKPLAEFGSIVCGKTPAKSMSEYFGEDIPFIKIPDMHTTMFVVNPTEKLSKLRATSQAKKTIPRGSICVSCIATVGKVVIATTESQTNQQINSVVPRSTYLTPYLYFYMLSLEKHFHDLASGGSATLNMNTSTFAKVAVLKPDEKMLSFFGKEIQPQFDKIESNQRESMALTNLRDTLLPKLLSGQLRIPDAQAAVDEALAET